MQMPQGTDFRMHKGETIDWKEGEESEYNSCSPQRCLRRESKKHWQNTDVCHVSEWWGQGHCSCTKCVGWQSPTCWFGAEQSQPDASSHSRTLQGSASQQYLDVGAEGSLAEFETKNSRRSCWHLSFQAAWELSLGQRALEQLWDDLGEKGRWEPVWQTKPQGASCACQGVWTLRSHHQSSSHLLLSAVSVGSKETLWYKHLKKIRERKLAQLIYFFQKKVSFC